MCVERRLYYLYKGFEVGKKHRQQTEFSEVRTNMEVA